MALVYAKRYNMNDYQQELLKQLTRIADAMERREKKRAPKPISRDPVVSDWLEEIPLHVQQSWVELFKDRIWVEAELKKAAVWCQTNPWKRQPGDTNARFGLAWLQRASDALKKQAAPEPSKSKEKAIPPQLTHEVVDNPDGTTSVKLTAINKDLRDWTQNAPWEKD